MSLKKAAPHSGLAFVSSRRKLVSLAAVDVVLFVILNNVHHTAQKVLLPLFLLGFLSLIVLGVTVLVRSRRSRTR